MRKSSLIYVILLSSEFANVHPVEYFSPSHYISSKTSFVSTSPSFSTASTLSLTHHGVRKERRIRILQTAKRKKRNTNGSKLKKNKTNTNSNNDNDDDQKNVEIYVASNRPIASLSGITEHHNYEQFFYSDKTTRDIYQVVKLYFYPLFLCNPSLAIYTSRNMKDSNKKKDGENDDDVTKPCEYLLLDRDGRFKNIIGGSNFKQFNLFEPILLTCFPQYDVIFIDPPFANITPTQIVNCIKRMAPPAPSSSTTSGTKNKLSVPIYIAYNSKREQELLDAFSALPCPKLERLWRLEYCSVSDDLEIYLYGPSGK